MQKSINIPERLVICKTPRSKIPKPNHNSENHDIAFPPSPTTSNQNLTSLIVHLTRTVGLQNKDLGLVGACREVDSFVVRLLFLQPVSFRHLALSRDQNSSLAVVRQKKNESHVSEDGEAKAKQHAQHQEKPSAKHDAYRDEDGPEEANRQARSAAMHGTHTPSGTGRLTHQRCPLA